MTKFYPFQSETPIHRCFPRNGKLMYTTINAKRQNIRIICSYLRSASILEPFPCTVSGHHTARRGSPRVLRCIQMMSSGCKLDFLFSKTQMIADVDTSGRKKSSATLSSVFKHIVIGYRKRGISTEQ
jgi:hypothetical protein